MKLMDTRKSKSSNFGSRFQPSVNCVLSFSVFIVVGDGMIAGRKLLYCSRTHTQIKQVVRELRKTAYKPRIMVMGSREQLCVNPSVRSQPPYAQKTLCHSLGPLCPYFERASVVAKHFYEDPSIPKNGTLDIEDLYDLGVRKRCCPYFLSRDIEITLHSQVVLLPYNYIMDPFIRSTLPFDMRECTVIIDEAHNIVGAPAF